MSGIPCPKCGATDSMVTDSRPADGWIRRRRRCAACRLSFTTHERMEERPFSAEAMFDLSGLTARDLAVVGAVVAVLRRPADEEPEEPANPYVENPAVGAIAVMARSGMTDKAIGSALGKARETVVGHRVRHRIEKQKRPAAEPPTKGPRETLLDAGHEVRAMGGRRWRVDGKQITETELFAKANKYRLKSALEPFYMASGAPT